jgi:hypothetical protein
MILRGKFEKLSLAVYGYAVVETPLPIRDQTCPLPSISVTPLPPSLNPANTADPTALAQSLMNLIPAMDRPTLPLITRLMFCLKPSNEDWDEPQFPHLYSDLEADVFDLNLEKATEMTGRPVSDDIDEIILRDFAVSVGDSIYDYVSVLGAAK